MKIPRDVSGQELAQALRCLGYQRTRQHGSHLRLTTQENGQHHITLTDHSPIRIGTLKSILKLVAQHHHMSLDELINKLGI